MADQLPAMVVWDPDEVSVLIRRDAPVEDVLRELRALLTVDLGAPEGTGSLMLCFCGSRVALPAELVLAPLTAKAC
ncbi:hypothetical protein ACIP3D_16155 [Streptomyces longwoodensis]|uniref:hypothetical protein n=1 Tax=Streptomyces longwoodensis TaxID=68231 RepID=UPI0033FE43BB